MIDKQRYKVSGRSLSLDVTFAVRSGGFNSNMLSDKDKRRVTGFSMPGEIIGMAGRSSRPARA